jgi:uncharacterized protein (DUF433 family)
MGAVTSLLDRRLYAYAQIDDLLGLRRSTAQRWIDGYSRRGKNYPPVIRREPSGSRVATWGEFVECRFLAEFRGAGVPMINMRPVFERLRDQLKTDYPLVSAALWLSPQGREIVAQVQSELGDQLESSLYVVRTGDQLLPLEWSPPATRFSQAVGWSSMEPAEIVRVWPDDSNRTVEINPLLSFGEPVVRGVRTSVIAELVRAGDPVEMVAELYELQASQVQAAVEYERRRAAA